MTLTRYFVALFTALFICNAAQSQQAIPKGACLMPDQRWCWPIVPVSAGQACRCSTPQGSVVGIMQ